MGKRSTTSPALPLACGRIGIASSSRGGETDLTWNGFHEDGVAPGRHPQRAVFMKGNVKNEYEAKQHDNEKRLY
jgi:hypothetical protein